MHEGASPPAMWCGGVAVPHPIEAVFRFFVHHSHQMFLATMASQKMPLFGANKQTISQISGPQLLP